MEFLQEFSLSLTYLLQSLSPTLDGLMQFFSFLGTIEFYLLIIPFLYWAVDSRLGFRVLLVLVSVHLFTAAIKILLHQPRPYWISDVKPLAQETTYGIPSGHSSGSMGIWGYLAHRMNRIWLWTAGMLIVLLVGTSRLYLGVHFLQDVVAGWLLGALVVVLVAFLDKAVSPWIKKQSPTAQISLAFSASLLIIAAVFAQRAALANVTDPPAWSAFSTHARAVTDTFTLTGALFGGTAGYILMKTRAPFRSDGAWPKRVVRYLAGLVGMFVLYYGLDQLFSLLAADETALGYLLRYTRYALVGLWVTCLAPWLFLKTGLAVRSDRSQSA